MTTFAAGDKDYIDKLNQLGGSLDGSVAAAAASAASSLSYLNDFKGRYYGAYAANPTLDPLGNPIGTGDIYWNTTASELRVYTGAVWEAPIPGSYVGSTGVTGSAILPSGTTAQRDGTPAFGYTRANSTTTQMEWWNGTSWSAIGGGGLTIADTAPTIPHANPFWWDSLNGALYVQYIDANSTQWVSASANIIADLSTKANIDSPTFTGVPAAPTAAVDTTTTQVATTAFVIGQAGTATPAVNGAATVGTSKSYSRQDHVHPTDTSRAAAGNVPVDIHAAASKSTPVDADELGLVDSASSFSLKSLTWANLKATLSTAFGIPEKSVIGKQTIWVPVGAMTPRTTFPAAAGSVETTNNKVMLKTLDFDQASNEFAQFAIQMPKSWNESTVTAKFLWKHAAATSYAVVWGIQAVALSDNEGADATAFGTAVTAIDTGGTTNNIYSSAETSAMTIAGSPAVQDWVVFQVYRDAADTGNDTLNQDAGLIGIQLFYTTDGVNDA